MSRHFAAVLLGEVLYHLESRVGLLARANFFDLRWAHFCGDAVGKTDGSVAILKRQ